MNCSRKPSAYCPAAKLRAGFDARINTGTRYFSLSKAICALLLLLAWAGSMQAASTVGQYRERIRKAVDVLNGLSAANENEMGTTMALGYVRALLPASDTVAAGNSELPVDNNWLHSALSDYEKAAPGKQRGDMLRRTTERLQALDVRLAELEAATPAGAASRDQNKKRLAQILLRSEYQKKQAESSALAKLWQRITKWISNLFPKSTPISSDSAVTVSRGAQFFVVALALAVLAYVIWKVAPHFMARRRSKKPGKRKARIVLGERLEPDQTAGDLLSDAEALARAGDLRAAIRKAYIALLCELGDRKVIRLAQYKTNRDYLRAVRQIAPLHAEMSKLTNSFESHWYGFEPATETEWNTFRSGYQRALTAQR